MFMNNKTTKQIVKIIIIDIISYKDEDIVRSLFKNKASNDNEFLN